MPDFINKFWLRIRALFLRRRLDRDLSDEIKFHLAMREQKLIAEGMTPQEAHDTARRAFGNATQTKETSRDMWTFAFLESLLQDLRYGLRQLRRNPGFTAVAVITLALGIGANTAIFSVVYAVLLKPLPYANPGQLVSVFEASPQNRIAADSFSYLNFRECRDHNRVFSEMAGYNAHDLVLTGSGEPAEAHTIVVTPELFSLLGVRPFLGRMFLPQDGVRGAAPVVVLSENLWRSRFGANPQIIGRAITLDQRAFTIVGIMPANFRFPLDTKSGDVWIPVIQDPVFSGFMSAPAGARFLITIGRMKPGVSIKQAQAAMNTMSARLAREFAIGNSGWIIHVEPLQQEIVGNVKSALLVLLGAVGLVLLLGCANIANLLLARATSRTREMAVRIALGAGRRRIVRQLVTESTMLGLLGGIAGIALAYWGVEALGSMLPPDLPRAQTIYVSGYVLIFALVLSAVAAVIFGLGPALFATGSSLPASLKESAARSGEGGRRRQAHNALAVAEIAIAMVLLVAAGLLIRSFAALTSVYPGFNARHVVTAEISLPRFQYSKPEQWRAFSTELLARIHAQPGLSDSAIGVPLPIADPFGKLPFVIEGNPPLPPGISLEAPWEAVSPDYFHVMQIPLLRGRLFTPGDSSMALSVAIISEALARRYFPNQDPIGRRLTFGLPPNANAARQIIGIVGDVHAVALAGPPAPMMYVPFDQMPLWGAVLAVRTSVDTPGAAAVIRRTTHQIDKNLPVTNIETLPQALSDSVAQPRFRTLLLGLFGAIALALAVIGIFGVMSYSVSRRTHEIGIRMALGATRGGILRLILAESANLIFLGLGLGAVAAIAITRFLSNLLYGVKPTDLFTYIGVSLMLTLVALLACVIPARRAAKVDPMAALRHE